MYLAKIFFMALLFVSKGVFAAQEVRIYNGPDILYEDHSPYAPRAQTPHVEEPDLPQPHAVCVTPKVASDCCYYTIYDGHSKKDVNYKGTKPVFGTEAASRAWAKKQVARMAFFLPYDGSQVSLGQGWHYDNGGEHSGLDSWRETVQLGKDVTFDVLAAAPGRVVTKLWDNWFGNTVIIEHTAKDGSKYRTIYMHLRDGYTHDLTAARAMVPPDPDANDNWAKYARFAKNNSDKLYWGQESHTIAVKVGDWVKMGQFIGKAGNTGAGGAGNGLKNDGTPNNKIRANNHLHFMLAAPNPKTAGEWVFVDSFGVYEKVNTGCYALMKQIDYPRFFAPYFPDFHNISWELYKFYFSYYPNMGLGPQTLSVYRAGSEVRAAGSFNEFVKTPWAVRGYLTSQEFDQWFNTYRNQGLRPRELQVQVGANGLPRFTAIWKKTAGEGYYTWINMTDADFQAKWADLVEHQGYRVEDHVSYTVNGQRRHGAIFVKDGQGFHLWYNLTQPAYQQKFDELWAQGWRTTSFNAAALPWGERYGSVWMKKPGAWSTWFNLSGSQYQQKYNEHANNGFYIWKVQGYRNGTRFGAIWTK